MFRNDILNTIIISLKINNVNELGNKLFIFIESL